MSSSSYLPETDLSLFSNLYVRKKIVTVKLAQLLSPRYIFFILSLLLISIHLRFQRIKSAPVKSFSSRVVSCLIMRLLHHCHNPLLPLDFSSLRPWRSNWGTQVNQKLNHYHVFTWCLVYSIQGVFFNWPPLKMSLDWPLPKMPWLAPP